ncbi:hypothetical protein F4604DRAFT_1682338 [Suillus subluteus]|nr:hypothetical protein F4604DRAFT_1682338 [Suillus subluteus]
MVLEPLIRPTSSVAPTAPASVKYNIFVAGNLKNTDKATSQPCASRKRKAEDDDADAMDTPKPSSPPQKPVTKRKKIRTDNTRVGKSGSRLIMLKPQEGLLPIIPDKVPESEGLDAVDMADDRGFWDAETRHRFRLTNFQPDGWGNDSAIATAVEHSIRHHPRKCDKCTKLNVPCLVLQDKKFGCTRLACANCDKMKITCAIDGVGIRERMQAKAKSKVAVAAANPPKCLKSRAKSRAISKPPAKICVGETSNVEPKIEDDLGAKQPIDVAPLDIVPAPKDIAPVEMAPLDIAPASLDSQLLGGTHHAGPAQQLEEVQIPAANHLTAPEPTARDILQGIQDLGRKFDMLATNKRVDVLDAREHQNDATVHRPRLNTTLYAPPQNLNAQLPGWLHSASGDHDAGISTIGRQWTHAWDPSAVTIGTSALAAQMTDTPDTGVLETDSIASSRLSSAPLVVSEKFNTKGRSAGQSTETDPGKDQRDSTSLVGYSEDIWEKINETQQA